MRISIMAALAALLLAGCGGSQPEEAQGEALTVDQAAAALEETGRLRPGQYATTVEMLDVSIPGMPGAQGEALAQMIGGKAATRATFCLTPEEAEQGPERMVEEMANADCRVESLDTRAGSFSADMHCTAPQAGEGDYRIEGTMTDESSTMTMRVDQAVPGVPGSPRVRLEMRVDSQRTGDCA